MNWGYTHLICPFESWDDLQVRNIFNEVVAVKKDGYGHNYKNVLPIETLDFISDHYLVWVEVDNKREYIAGMKGVSFQKLKQYNLELPCLSLLRTIKTVALVSDHLESLQTMLNNYRGSEDKVNYFNGWTIKPQFRGKDELSQLLKLASVASIAFVQEECGYHRLGIGSGMPHLKTDKVFAQMGYSPWQLQGANLPALPSPSYDMKETLFMQGTSTPLEYLSQIEFLKPFWEGREILGNEFQKSKKAA